MKTLSSLSLGVALAFLVASPGSAEIHPDDLQAPAAGPQGRRTADQIQEPAEHTDLGSGRPVVVGGNGQPRVSAGDSQQPAVNEQVRVAVGWALDPAASGVALVQPGASRVVTLTASYHQLSGVAREQIDRVIGSAGDGPGMGAVLQALVSEPDHRFTLTLVPTSQSGQFRIADAHNNPLSDNTAVLHAAAFAATAPTGASTGRGVIAAQSLGSGGGVMLSLRAGQLSGSVRDQLQARAADETAAPSDRTAATAVLNAEPGVIVSIAVNLADGAPRLGDAGAARALSPTTTAGGPQIAAVAQVSGGNGQNTPVASIPVPSAPRVSAPPGQSHGSDSILIANAPAVNAQAYEPARQPLGVLRSIIFSRSMPMNPTAGYLNGHNVGKEFGKILAEDSARRGQAGNPSSPYSKAVNALTAANYNAGTRFFDAPPANATEKLRDAWSKLNQIP